MPGRNYYYSGFNRCPYQLLEVNIKDTKRTRGRVDRNVAPCRQTTTVIGPLHECKKVCPCTKALPHSGIRAWIKQDRKKRKKRGRETRKTEARRFMERKAAQQNKNLSEELKQGLPRHSWGFNKAGEWQEEKQATCQCMNVSNSTLPTFERSEISCMLVQWNAIHACDKLLPYKLNETQITSNI